MGFQKKLALVIDWYNDSGRIIVKCQKRLGIWHSESADSAFGGDTTDCRIKGMSF